MFSLIISIISIALVASLALASIYYGGAAFNKGTTDADASTIINQGQQIQAAVTLSDVDRTVVANLAGLVTGNYLQEVPSFEKLTWGEPDVNGYSVLSGDVNQDVCNALNVKAGVGTESTPVANTADNGIFGCATDLTGSAGKAVPFYRIGEFYSL